MIEKIKVAFFAILIMAIIALIKLGEVNKDIEKYNNGYCKECNIKYETSYIMDDGQKYIVYKCPHCYKMGNINTYWAE